jgi:hypothetical protein
MVFFFLKKIKNKKNKNYSLYLKIIIEKQLRMPLISILLGGWIHWMNFFLFLSVRIFQIIVNVGGSKGGAVHV